MKFMSSVRELTAVDYKMLDRRRTELWQDLASLFSVYDALLCPTMCITAPAIGMSDADFTMIDETGRLHAMDMTCLFNLVGQCPVVAVPSGLDLGGAADIGADRRQAVSRLGCPQHRSRP
jgi:Asp-tRNA(Asn)/Glu-tRNA(Gln) amidotransferase A subunit family amidase